MKKILFIHVPKTSGSTLKLFFKGIVRDFYIQANSARQLEQRDPLVGPVRNLDDIKRVLDHCGGLALHVDSNFDAVRKTTDFRSLAWHLFEPDNVDYFEQFTILMMLRHPFRGFLSSYAFLKRSKEEDPGFLPDLDSRSVETYLDAVHENAVLHFLLEADLSHRRSVHREDLERVKDRVSKYPIHVGIYERYRESIAYFARVMGRDFEERDLPAHNVGRGVVEHDKALEATFRGRNQLDFELYEFAARLLNERLRSLPPRGSRPP